MIFYTNNLPAKLIAINHQSIIVNQSPIIALADVCDSWRS